MSDLSPFTLSLGLSDQPIPSHHIGHLVNDPLLFLRVAHLQGQEVVEPYVLVVVEVPGELEEIKGKVRVDLLLIFLLVDEGVLLLLLQVEDVVFDAHERHCVSIGARAAVALPDEDEFLV